MRPMEFEYTIVLGGKWFTMPAHLEGSGCPSYLTEKQYPDMQWMGKNITPILRHRSRRDKLGDGAAIDPTTLARLCSRKFGYHMDISDAWGIIQEGKADGKGRRWTA